MTYRGIEIRTVETSFGVVYEADYPDFGRISDATLGGIKRTIELLSIGYRPGGV